MYSYVNQNNKYKSFLERCFVVVYYKTNTSFI